MSLPNRVQIQAGDQAIADGLIPTVIAAIHSNLSNGYQSFYVSIPGATPGAGVLVMAATCEMGLAVEMAGVDGSGAPRLKYGRGGPPFVDPYVPEDTDPIADAAMAAAIEPAITAQLNVLLAGSGTSVVSNCAANGSTATDGAMMLLLLAGRRAGWTSNRFFPLAGMPRVRFSR